MRGYEYNHGHQRLAKLQTCLSRGSLPSQAISLQTTTSMTNQLPAIAGAERGGGATVIPVTVNMRMTRISAQSDLPRASLLPRRKMHMPSQQNPVLPFRQALHSASAAHCTVVACRCYAVPDPSEDPLRTSTSLPITPPVPSNSCACLALARGNRRAISGLIFRC